MKHVISAILHTITFTAIGFLILDKIQNPPKVEVVNVIEFLPEPEPINIDHVNCMARNIYWEARNQPRIGMLAVAHVVINRTQDGRWPSDPCQVIYQRRGDTCQFSWVCTNNRDRQPTDRESWNKALEVAHLALHGYPDVTEGAVFFRATSMAPRKALRINDHAFYR